MTDNNAFKAWLKVEAEPYRAGRFSHNVVSNPAWRLPESESDRRQFLQTSLSLEYHAAKAILEMPSPPRSLYPLAIRMVALIEQFMGLFNTNAEPAMMALCAKQIGECAAFMQINHDDLESTKGANERKKEKAQDRANALLRWLAERGWTVDDLKVVGRDALAKGRKDDAWKWFKTTFPEATQSMFVRARKSIEDSKA